MILVLNQEVVGRIYSFLDNPTEFALACKQIHRYTSSPNSKILWLMNHMESVRKVSNRIFTPLSPAIFIPIARKLIPTCYSSQEISSIITSLLHKVDSRFQPKLYISCILQSLQSPTWKPEVAVKLFNSSGLQFFAFESYWDKMSESGFRLVLVESLKSKKISLESESELDVLLETVYENDYDYCLELLLKLGVKVSSSSLRTVTYLNKPKCAQILLKYGTDPHFDNDACFYDAAAMGHTKILYLLSKYWDEALASQILYTAVENDQVETVEFLVKMALVKSDRESLVLAMDPSRGKTRNLQGQNCLQVLIECNQDISSMTNISRQAVRSVCNFVESL